MNQLTGNNSQMNCACNSGFLLEGVKPKKLTGIPVVYADRPGRNRNIYPKEELKKGIEYYKKLTELDPTYKYSFAKHPKDENEEWIGLIAGVVDDLYFDDSQNCMKMDVTLLPTVWGHFIAWALEQGYVIGTSLRGDAQPSPGTYELSGKTINVQYRSDLRLEGIDFVVYPSFITTHATKEHVTEQTSKSYSIPYTKVVEQYIKHLGDSCGWSVDELEEILLNKENKTLEQTTTSRRNRIMGNLEHSRVEELQLELDKLAVQKGQIELELSTLGEKKSSLTQEVEDLEQQLKSLKEKVQTKVALVSELEQTQKKLAEVSDQLQAKQKELELVTQQLEQVREKASKAVIVRIAGQVFDEDNPPKIRVVDPSEKVSDSEWGNVDKDKIRQLVWLTKDKELAKKVFGLVGDMKDWRELKYPVYQAFKSSEDGYDIDLVLNPKALATATAYIFGRAGMALSKKDKQKVINFLYSKYEELEKEGIAEVPASLKKAKKATKVLEKIEIQDSMDVVSPILESAILNGLLEVEGLEEVQESAQDQQDNPIAVSVPTKAYEKLVNALASILTNSDENKVFESVNLDEVPKGEDLIIRLLKNNDGTPTDLASQYDITSVDEFKTKFIDKMTEEAKNGAVGTVLQMIQQVLTTFFKVLDEDMDEDSMVINPVFEMLLSFYTEQPKPEENPEQNPEENPEQQPNQNKVQEKAKENIEENNKNGGLDMLLEKMKELLEGHFEGVSIENEEQVIETVTKLINDYNEIFGQLQEAEFEKVKEQKVRELMEAGVSKDIIDEELADIETAEELEIIADKLKKVVSKVKESVSKNEPPLQPQDLEGKGHSVPGSNQQNSADTFDKLMKEV